MGWRKGHGMHKEPVVIEVQPADEMAKVNQLDIDARKASQERIGRPFKKGNKAGGRKPKLAKLGLRTEDEGYKRVLKAAESYRRTRSREFKITHGYVSIGVSALIATASLQLAVSRHLLEQAMKGGCDVDLIKRASAMANEARQNELAAWELASREGGAKAKAAANMAPWMASELKVRVSDEVSPWVGENVSETSQGPLAAAEEDADNSGVQGDITDDHRKQASSSQDLP